MFFNVKILMKIHVLIIAASLTLLLVPYGTVHSEDQIEYTIQIDNKGSVTWIIIQVVDINASLDTWEEFQNKVTSLVETAKNKTQRDITVETDSLAMTITNSWSSKTVEYKFYWKNFSKIENTKIIVGDVFQVEDFFLRLYGDGEFYITYPSQYVVETVLPFPNKRDDSIQMLKWFRTQDFINGKPNITLINKSQSQGFLETLGQNAILIVGLALVAMCSSIGFYVFRRHKKREKETMKTPELQSLPGIESAEEKIVKVLKSSGGSLYQSAIADQCKFSKAKTSQVLAVLEDKRMVSRYKRGRDKIVTLVEKDKR